MEQKMNETGKSMTFYDYSGLKTKEEKNAAVKLTDKFFYVREYRGDLFDPRGLYSSKKNDTKWRSVSENCMGLYLKYLQNGSVSTYRLAERALKDG